MSESLTMNLPAAYALAPEGKERLEAISVRLQSPRHLSYENRRDLAKLIDLICSRSLPITNQ